mgnify:CR=1 FL=1
MKLSIPSYSSDLFSWYMGNGYTEISDLPCAPAACQVYDDACDVGFNVRSERTGKVMLFTLSEVSQDKEGDISDWVYVSTNGKHKIVVVND